MIFDNLLPEGGNGNEDTANKLPQFDSRHYAPFGQHAETFKGMGWIPERWNNEFTEYRAPSTSYFSNWDLNDGKGSKGYLSIKGGNNGVFDLLMKDPSGNAVGKPILQGVNADTLHNYFTNTTSKDNYGGQQEGSMINQRYNKIANGTFASLY